MLDYIIWSIWIVPYEFSPRFFSLHLIYELNEGTSVLSLWIWFDLIVKLWIIYILIEFWSNKIRWSNHLNHWIWYSYSFWLLNLILYRDHWHLIIGYCDMWIYWNTYEISNASFFLDLLINYNIYFWHDLWNNVWTGWMIFCYENIIFWYVMIKHDWAYWFHYALYWSILIPHNFIFFYQIRIRNMIYEEFWYKNNMNWQPDYVKDPVNGSIYVGNWFVLRVYIASETSDMSLARLATNRQWD